VRRPRARFRPPRPTNSAPSLRRAGGRFPLDIEESSGCLIRLDGLGKLVEPCKEFLAALVVVVGRGEVVERVVGRLAECVDPTLRLASAHRSGGQICVGSEFKLHRYRHGRGRGCCPAFDPSELGAVRQSVAYREAMKLVLEESAVPTSSARHEEAFDEK
jgi:hypothetical protein